MNVVNLIYPMFAMVLLTAAVLVILFRSRVRAIRERQLTKGYFATYQGEVVPDYAAKPARHFSNLFEAPILFYVACLAAMIMQLASPWFLALAWIYVALRGLHAYIHLGRNQLRSRIAVYAFSWLGLLAMWVGLAISTAMRSS